MAARIRDLVREARLRLKSAPHRPAGREAELILGHVLGWTEAQVTARDDRTLDAEIAGSFEALLARRLAGEPYAYLTGEREFFGRSFRVDRRVLIPRPETEHLIEACLSLDLPAEPRILDVGTGSGCIAVTLALELGGSRVVGVDRSIGAAAAAASNARRLGAGRCRIAAGDLTDAVDVGGFDLVVSNPPYVTPEDAGLLSSEITDYEPTAALFAGDGGLEVYRRLCAQLVRQRPGTHAAFEVGDGQADAVLDLAAGHGFERTAVKRDYAGTERVVVVNKVSAPGGGLT